MYMWLKDNMLAMYVCLLNFKKLHNIYSVFVRYKYITHQKNAHPMFFPVLVLYEAGQQIPCCKGNYIQKHVAPHLITVTGSLFKHFVTQAGPIDEFGSYHPHTRETMTFVSLNASLSMLWHWTSIGTESTFHPFQQISAWKSSGALLMRIFQSRLTTADKCFKIAW